jgi:hypothetical protein
LDPEQKLDDLPGADHLGDEIEQYDDETARRGNQADWRSLKTKSCGVGEGEASEIAHAFRHHEENDRPAGEEADGIQQPVESIGVNQRGDTEKCRR